MHRIASPRFVARFAPVRRRALMVLAAALVSCGDSGSSSVALPSAGMGVTIGGQISGLGAGHRVVLVNNGHDALPIGVNGGFYFPTRLPAGGVYAVTIQLQPAGQRCVVTQGQGIAQTSVGDVTVVCVN